MKTRKLLTHFKLRFSKHSVRVQLNCGYKGKN